MSAPRATGGDPPPASPLAGSVAIVTGGSGGIGLAAARALAERGARVVISGRDTARVEAAVNRVSGARGLPGCDIRKSGDVEALMEFAVAGFGRIDVIVHAAGIGRGGGNRPAIPPPVANLEEDEWREVLDTNLRGAFLVCRAAARRMLEQGGGGQILNISSSRGASRGQAFGAPYCASKMAARVMLHAMADELAPHGIRVMSLLPDAVETDLIAGTRLARRGAIGAGTIGEIVCRLLELPMDCLLDDPLVMPWRARA